MSTNSMQALALPLTYLAWHYATAWEDLFRLYRNFAWFLWNFFSIRILFETLLSPWHRRHEMPDKQNAGVLGSFILNTILRLVGALIRSTTIFVGLLVLLVYSLLYLCFLVLWPFLPLLIIASLVAGATGLAGF